MSAGQGRHQRCCIDHWTLSRWASPILPFRLPRSA